MERIKLKINQLNNKNRIWTINKLVREQHRVLNSVNSENRLHRQLEKSVEM